MITAAPPRVLNGWHALGLVAGYVLAQFLGGFAVGLSWSFSVGFETALQGGHVPRGLQLGPGLLAFSVLLGMLVAGVWVWFFSAHYARAFLRDPGPTGVAWRPAPFRGYGVAVLTALLLILLVIWVERLYPPDLARLTGPMERLAHTSGFAYFLFAVSVVLVAPPLEEFVFRGVAFAAVACSFGTSAAVVLTTLAFVALHYADKIHYWPGFLLVGTLGLAAAGLRLRYQSLWPGIVLHCGYNGMVLLLH